MTAERIIQYHLTDASHPSGFVFESFENYAVTPGTKGTKGTPGTPGMVRNVKTNEYIKPYMNADGYYHVCLYKDGKQYHRSMAKIIMSTFGGPPTAPGLTVDHMNGNRADNSIGNLEWSTASEQNGNRGTYSKTASKIALIGYHKETNETRTFASASDAAKELGKGFSRSSISTAVQKSRTYKGWTFTKVLLPDIDGQVFTEVFDDDGTPSGFFVGNLGYSIDTDGTVRNTTSNSGVDPVKKIGGKNKQIHILVAIAFLGEAPGPGYVVDHIDGVKNNACAANLQWLTKSENAKKAHEDKKRKWENTYDIDGTEYRTIEDVSAALGIPYGEIYNRTNSPDFPRFIKLAKL